MKVLKRILFTSFFIAIIFANSVFAETGEVSIEAARVRSKADTSSDIVTVIYEGDEVNILDESGDWYKIKYKDDTGFVKKEFIKTKTSSQTSKENTAQNTVKENSKNTTSENTNTSKQEEKPKEEQKEEQPQNPTPEAQTENNLYINAETYIKVLPNFTSTNIAKFEVSKQVTKIKELGNWIQVTDGEKAGWLLKVKVQQTEVPKPEEKPKEPTQEPKKENGNTVTNNPNTTSNNTANVAEKTNTTSSSSSTLNKKAVVIVETANVREKPTTNSETIGALDYGDEIVLLEEENDWYKIDFENKTGYVKGNLVKISNENVSSRSIKEEREEKVVNTEEVKNTSSKASEIVDFAKQYLGYSYIVGGKSPSTGFDCSGFTRYVFREFGYSLGSTSSSQAGAGTPVSREELKPGDLILFLGEDKSGIGHTGIYIGNGEFIHSANPQRGVVTDNLNSNSYYNERFVSGRRIAN